MDLQPSPHQRELLNDLFMSMDMPMSSGANSD